MSDQPVLRLFHCRPVRAAFDAILRDVMLPDLATLPGLLDARVGRTGPGDLGDRLVATVWDSRAAMVDAMGDDVESSRFHPEYLHETTDRSLETLDLKVLLRFGGELPPTATATVMRLARGSVRPGELASYVDEAREGARDDHARGGGPTAFYLGVGEPDCFTTLSIWDAWSTIETATGADVRRPVATQRGDQLSSFSVIHYEIVPGLVEA